jgi:hypothetical protein
VEQQEAEACSRARVCSSDAKGPAGAMALGAS